MNTALSMDLAVWMGVYLCITQSAMFSGMNLALFSIGRLKLEVQASLGNPDASKILDLWLGSESIQYFRESSLREVIKKHIESAESDVDRLEGIGVLNFLAIDDLMVVEEGRW